MNRNSLVKKNYDLRTEKKVWTGQGRTGTLKLQKLTKKKAKIQKK